MWSGLLIFLAFSAAALAALTTAAIIFRAMHPPRHTLARALARRLPTDPGSVGVPFERADLVRDGDVRLTAWRCAAGSGAGTIVLIHGWGESRFDRLPGLPFWHARSKEVLVVDRRGHGDSSGLAGVTESEADDLQEWIRAAPQPVIVIAWSQALVPALVSAARPESAVSAVILIGPPLRWSDALGRMLHDSGVPRYPCAPMAAAILRCLGWSGDRADELAARCKCPVLVLRGSRDALVSAEEARAVALAARAPYLEIDGAGHQEIEPHLGAEATAAIDAFVRSAAVR